MKNLIYHVLTILLRAFNNIWGGLLGVDMEEIRRRIRWQRITGAKTMKIK
jgi:hypothetical protein